MDVTDVAIRMAGSAATAVAAGHGLPVGGAVFEALIRDLLQVQDEQAQTLLRIEQGVERLIDGPWRTAKLYLQECLLPGRSASQIQEAQRKAAECLREALGQQRGFPAAYSAFDLAVVLAALGDAEGSRFYAKLSLTSASDAVIEHQAEISQTIVAEQAPVVGKLRRLRSALTPAPKNPRNVYRWWYLHAVAVSPLCKDTEIFSQRYRIDPSGVWLGILLDHNPELRSENAPRCLRLES